MGRKGMVWWTGWLGIALVSLVWAQRPSRPPSGGPALGATPSAEAGQGETVALHIEATPEGLSVFAVRAEAHQFFIELGKAAQVPIIVDDTVNRQVTVNLHGFTFQEVLDYLATAYGFSCSQVNGFWVVSEGIPNNPSSYLLSDIDAIRTQYVLAADAKALLPVFLQEHVKPNAAQNSVILSAPAPLLRKFREDIEQFDKPASQIMIHILMVEVTDTGREELESLLRWQNARRGFQSDTALGALTLRGVATLPEDFTLRLQALVTQGKARVRANPSIATVSGRRASIFIGQQRFLSTPVQVGVGRYDQINFIDAGVRLEMTPWTGDGQAVIAEIRAEVSTMGAPDPITGLPDKTVRRANTMVRVLDGETIVIGGLRQTELRSREGKIPLLGDIPLLGTFFRSRHLERTNTELILFITPRVLSLTGHLPQEEEEALKRRLEGRGDGP